jgi:opacity protein-like surface antigen
MRRWLVALCLVGFASHANAGDFDTPTLRGSSPFVPGPPQYTRWNGFYFGGMIGSANASFDFGNATESLVATVLRNTWIEEEFHASRWPQLRNGGDRGATQGGFIGYNTQWQDVVVGIEATYTRLSVGATSSDSIGRILTHGDFDYAVQVTSAAAYSLTDYGSLRVRAGWAISQFLPYLTGGLAVGRGSYFRSATVSYPVPTYNQAPPTPPDQPPPNPPSYGPVTESHARTDATIWGYALGGGVDIAVMPNVFVRAEYEYVGLPIAGMQLNLHNFRVGGGFKF